VTAGNGRVVLAGLLTVVVAAALAAGFAVVGSPAEARVERVDARRADDLQTIRAAVQVFASRNHRLPAALDDLGPERGTAPVPRDPASGDAYGYRVNDARHYELCAEFARVSPGRPYPWTADFAAHGAGRQCYDLQVPAAWIH
jgi:hypothetical protein